MLGVSVGMSRCHFHRIIVYYDKYTRARTTSVHLALVLKVPARSRQIFCADIAVILAHSKFKGFHKKPITRETSQGIESKRHRSHSRERSDKPATWSSGPIVTYNGGIAPTKRRALGTSRVWRAERHRERSHRKRKFSLP